MYVLGIMESGEWFVTRNNPTLKYNRNGYLISGAVLYRAQTKQECEEFFFEFLKKQGLASAELLLTNPAYDYLKAESQNRGFELDKRLGLPEGFCNSFPTEVLVVLDQLLTIEREDARILFSKLIPEIRDCLYKIFQEVLKEGKSDG